MTATDMTATDWAGIAASVEVPTSLLIDGAWVDALDQALRRGPGP